MKSLRSILRAVSGRSFPLAVFSLFSVLALCIPGSAAYALSDDFFVHRLTLFSSGEELSTVPEGMLLQRGDTVYVDVERFYRLFGYRVVKYPDSKLMLAVNHNHRVLYMVGQPFYNEVGSFYEKGNLEDTSAASTESAAQSESASTTEAVSGGDTESSDVGGRRNEKVGVDRPMSEAAFLVGELVYAPFADVLNIFGISPETGEYTTVEVPSFEGLGSYRTTREEVKNFARIIYYETRDSSMLKKTAVGGVVMNRVHSRNWPNTVNSVIFAKNQFPPAYYEGFRTLEPPAVQYEGAVRSLNGENNAPGCFFFNLAPFRGKEADFYRYIEGDYFYY